MPAKGPRKDKVELRPAIDFRDMTSNKLQRGAPMISFRILALGMVFLFAPGAYADPQPGFTFGPVIANYGPVADVKGAAPIPKGTHFKVVFDVSEGAEPKSVNSGIEAAARFLNMHVRAGVPLANIKLAIVVRGPAIRDLAMHPRPGEDNANAPLIAALLANHVDIYACGQAAAHAKVAAGELLPGVKLVLSAMTELALLQQQGYTLNPS
jgi:intracellular sulfur oxidation DsrE/DsrF family protein